MQTSLLDYQKISKGELRIDEVVDRYKEEGDNELQAANYTSP